MAMRNLSKTLALSMGAMLLSISVGSMAMASPLVEITMKNNGYHIGTNGTVGSMGPGFTLAVGEKNTVVLKNEDTTAHDFVSKMFNDMDVVVSGETKSVHSNGATGFRVMPGKSVKLTFTPRVSEDFSGSWDVFWCPIHGQANMKGEVILADTRTGSGAF